MTTATILTTYESSTHAELTQWLIERKSAGADKLILRRRSEDIGSHEMVRNWPLEGQIEEEAAELAGKILHTAHDEARFLGNAVYGVFAVNGRQSLGRYVFEVEGESLGEQSFVPAAPVREPNLASVLASHMGQMMRHNESKERLHTGHTLDVIGHYKALLSARERRIEELEKNYAHVLVMQERLLSMQHRRDIESRKVDIEAKKADFATTVFADAVQAGTKFLQNKMDEKVGIEQLLGSITSEQMDGLMTTLRPEQMSVVIGLYQKYAEKNGVKKEEAAPPKSDPKSKPKASKSGGEAR
jgi:hypothetical protein